VLDPRNQGLSQRVDYGEPDRAFRDRSEGVY
jgi:hypothetical protein